MNEARAVWRINMPELLGLADWGLDDLGVGADESIYVADSVNGGVYRLCSTGDLDRAFDVIRPGMLNGEETGLNLAVAADSSFYVGDPGSERVVRYDGLGQAVGEFSASGLRALCCTPDDTVCVLASDGDGERIDCYDFIGSRFEILCAPRRHRSHLDPALVSMDTDTGGCAYISYGMPPYRVWRVSRTGEVPDGSEDLCVPSELEAWGRTLDHPEDAVLISDIAYDRAGQALHVLMAFRESGLQALDSFSRSGEFLGSTALPYNDNLYSGICTGGGGSVYLLDAVGGDLVRISMALP